MSNAEATIIELAEFAKGRRDEHERPKGNHLREMPNDLTVADGLLLWKFFERLAEINEREGLCSKKP